MFSSPFTSENVFPCCLQVVVKSPFLSTHSTIACSPFPWICPSPGESGQWNLSSFPQDFPSSEEGRKENGPFAHICVMTGQPGRSQGACILNIYSPYTGWMSGDLQRGWSLSSELALAAICIRHARTSGGTLTCCWHQALLQTKGQTCFLQVQVAVAPQTEEGGLHSAASPSSPGVGSTSLLCWALNIFQNGVLVNLTYSIVIGRVVLTEFVKILQVNFWIR